jgi:hypothetical protein
MFARKRRDGGRARGRVVQWAMALVAAMALGVAGLVGAAALAYADDGPNPGCYLASGSISAPSPVTYGQLVTVSWSVDPGDYCGDYAVIVTGPGFSGGDVFGSSAVVRAIANGPTATWTVELLDLVSGYPYALASVTISVL